MLKQSTAKVNRSAALVVHLIYARDCKTINCVIPYLFFFSCFVYIQVINSVLKVNSCLLLIIKAISKQNHYKLISYQKNRSMPYFLANFDFLTFPWTTALLTSHSGFFFFLLVDLVACLVATYLTGCRGRIEWSPTRKPLDAMFIFYFPPSHWNPVSDTREQKRGWRPSGYYCFRFSFPFFLFCLYQ